MPSTVEQQETFPDHREIREFQAKNKGLAQSAADALNQAVLAEEARKILNEQ
jgi:hypothetical protein